MPNPFDVPRFTMPTFDMPAVTVPKITFAAEEVFKIVRDRIGALERELDTVKGATATGARAEFYQHVSQLSVMFVVAKKSGTTAKRVGFEAPPPEPPSTNTP